MANYGMEDVFLTRKVCDHQDAILAKNPDLQAVVDFEHEDMAALYAVEKRGMPVDEQGYRRLEIELVENLEAMDDRLNALARLGVEPEDLDAFEFNPRSSKQILEALKRRGADLAFVTNDSMDKENLETVEDELAAAILDFRSEFKVLSTYVRPYIGRSYETGMRAWKEPFIAPDGRIHANYRQVGAGTGRMSCSDPNIQNQPRDDLRLRYNYRAEPGMALVTCDLNSIEFAIFAAYAGEGRLLEAVREGRDIHQMTADFAGIRERVRPGGHIESARQRAKVFGFSIIYGAGVRSIRKQMRCSQAEARLYLRRYHDAYPEVARLQATVEWRLQDRGYIKSAWGRRFRLDPRDAYKGVNYLVQGTAADLLKASLIRLHKDGVPVVGLIHDEIVAHVPIADAEECRRAMSEALTDHPRITEKVPLSADGDIVERWSQAKDPNFVPKWKLLQSA
jgi:DNA polymerase-1